MHASAETIEQYIARFPADVRKKLEQVQSAIRRGAPEASEEIKYGMPSYVLNGNLIFFAGYPQHISVYPRTKAMDQLKDKIARYESGRGTLKFPLSEPIPFDLIEELTAIRVVEAAAEAKAKKKASGAVAEKKSGAKKKAGKTGAKKKAGKKAVPRKVAKKKAGKKAVPRKVAKKKAGKKTAGKKKRR